VDFPDRVVDVDERHRLGPGQQPRRHLGQAGHHPGGDGVELADVPERERAQERAHRRRRPDPGEDLAHPAMAQDVEVVDRVGAGQHPRDHARRLPRRVGRRDAQPLLQQVTQARPVGQPHHRDQTRRPDQVRVIEYRVDLIRVSAESANEAVTCGFVG